MSASILMRKSLPGIDGGIGGIGGIGGAADHPPRLLKVGGVTPFSTTDYPGKLAAVVFVQGCPLRCGYCHNPHLQARTNASAVPWAGVMALLRRRVGLIDAVVFSGGEPTIDAALGAAIADVRAMGLAVGLHTAGCYPERLIRILPLLDWVGLDIKAPFERYQGITGVDASGAQARACAQAVVASGVAYECRTTIHPELLDEGDIAELAQSLAAMGVRHYALQLFRAQGCKDAELKAGAGMVSAAADAYPSKGLVRRVAALFDQFTLRGAH